MNVSKFRQLIEKSVRKVIKEELSTMLNELTETKETKKSKPVNDSIDDRVTDVLNESRQKQIGNDTTSPKQTFSTNGKFNSLLNETYENGEWKTMDGGYTSKDVSGFGGRNSVPTIDPDGREINMDSVSDGVKGALTRDYSAVLKKSKELSKKR